MQQSLFIFFILTLSAPRALGDDRFIRQLNDELSEARVQVELTTNTYQSQLLNQDPLSTPRLQQRLSDQLQNYAAIQSSLEAETLARGQKTSTSQSLYIPPDVAVRTLFYQEKMNENIRQEVVADKDFPIQLQSFRASQGDHRNCGYTFKKAPPMNQRCASGGFLTQSQKPERPKDTTNLLNDFTQWQSRQCKTPSQVQLLIDGQKVKLSCSPGSVKDENTQRAFHAMQMCDPLLYGFHLAPLKTPQRALALCAPPQQDIIGRSSIYSYNILGRTSGKGDLESLCEAMAKSYVSPRVKPKVSETTTNDLSLILAAKLAMENNHLWTLKKKHVHNYCDGMSKKYIEYDTCQSLLRRVIAIEDIMKKRQQKTLTEFQEKEIKNTVNSNR